MRLLLLFVICHFPPPSVTLSKDSCRRNESIDIHIIGFFPCTDPNDRRGIPVDNCDGIERIPIMKLALEEINERCNVLPGYRLVVNYANSACSSIPALHHFIKLTDPSQPHKPILLGPVCSESNFIMGEVAERFLNINQVSYGTVSELFTTDKISYPRFFRLVPRSQQFVDVVIAIINELKWKRVAMVTYATDFLFSFAQYTEQKLQESGASIVTNQNFANNDPHVALEQIKKVNARIIIAWLPVISNVILKFWCMAIRSQLTGPQFVWVLPGWYRPGWWNVSDINCTAEEMKNGLEHSLSIAVDSVIANDLSRMTVSGKNVSQFQQDLAEANTVYGNVELDTALSIGYLYDAVWTIALALNSSISILEERGLGKLEDFTYDSVEMADVLTEAVANVSFEGISESVSFQKNGNRVGYSVRIHQYRGGKRIPVLKQDSADSFEYFPGQSLIWQSGEVPKDGPGVVSVIVASSLTECIIAGIVSSVGILSTIFFFVFNFYYYNHPVVKKSSYRLNSLILVGVFIGFTGTVLHIIHLDSDMPEALTTTVCNARAWTSELAFVIAFGTMFAKVWRLYKVFFNKKMVKRKYLHDRHLFMMVAIIVAPTLVTLIVQVTTFPLTLHTAANVATKDDFYTEEIYSECRGIHEFLFSSLVYAEDGILALFSVVVAYQTQRHSPKQDKYRKYNESAVINLTTILAVLLSSICQAILIIFQLNHIQQGFLLIILVRDCLWMYPMIYLLFTPKVYVIFSGKYSNKVQLFKSSAISTLVVNVRSSFSSLSGRRTSLNSDISSSERMGRKLSDISLGSADTHKLNGVKDINSSSSLVKREVIFSPIHEYSEEFSDAQIEDNIPVVISLDPNTMNGGPSREVACTHSDIKCSEL